MAKNEKAAADLLEEKRAALAAAEAALAASEATFDERAAIEARNRVEMLKRFVARLERDAAAQREEAAREAAREWLKDHVDVLTPDHVREKVGAAQEKSRKKLAELLAALEEEAKVRAEVDHLVTTAEVLHARFRFTNGTRRGFRVRVDVGPVARLADRMRGGRGQRVTLFGVASDTPERRGRRHAEQAQEFVRRYPATLPEEVREILASAPTVEAAGEAG